MVLNKEILFFVSFICMLTFSLGAVGVSPSSYDVDFKPNLEGEYSFTFLSNENTDLSFEVIGTLANYVKIISEKRVSNNKYNVVVKMKLPEKVDTPGLNIIRISGKEKLRGDSGGIALGLNVNALIKVRVPYPAKYAELNLNTELINQGENLPYELTIYSRGEEDILAKPTLEVRDLEGSLVKKIELSATEIKSTKNEVFKGELSTKTYSPGDYNLIAIVEYDEGKFVNTSSLIRLGEMKVKILEYTATYQKDKLNYFTLKIESLWNNPLENVYADVEVLDYPHKSFTTPSITLNAWGEKNLAGYLDTIGIEENIIQLKLNVHYGGKSTSQIVNITQEKHFNWVVLLIVLGSVIILSIILFLIVYIMKLKNKTENEARKKFSKKV